MEDLIDRLLTEMGLIITDEHLETFTAEEKCSIVEQMKARVTDERPLPIIELYGMLRYGDKPHREALAEALAPPKVRAEVIEFKRFMGKRG